MRDYKHGNLAQRQITRWGAQTHVRAKFNTRCPACGEAIKAGKEISRDSQDRWVHKHCNDMEEELP